MSEHEDRLATSERDRRFHSGRCGNLRCLRQEQTRSPSSGHQA